LTDHTKDENPVKNWAHIFIPLCTADNHWGNISRIYDAGLAISHKGAANVLASLQWVFSNYPTPAQILVSGWGAGGYGAALWAPHIMQQYPTIRVVLLVDSASDVSNFSSIVENGAAYISVPPLVSTALVQYTTISLKSWNIVGSAVSSPAVSVFPPTFTIETALTSVATYFPQNPIAVVSFSRDSFQLDYTVTKVSSTPVGLQNFMALSAVSQVTGLLSDAWCKGLHGGLASLDQTIDGIGGNFTYFISPASSHGATNTHDFFTAGGKYLDNSDVLLQTWLASLLAPGHPPPPAPTPC
jgi:hypothetical protein